MKIFIARLPYQYQEAEITELFAAYGTVKSVNVIMDRETGRSKCFAFVEMPDDSEANTAIAELNERRVLDKNIAVSEAREKERPAGGFGGDRRSSGNGGGGYRDRNSGGDSGFKKYGNDDKRSGGYRDKYSGGGDKRSSGNSGGGFRDRNTNDNDY